MQSTLSRVSNGLRNQWEYQNQEQINFRRFMKIMLNQSDLTCKGFSKHLVLNCNVYKQKRECSNYFWPWRMFRKNMKNRRFPFNYFLFVSGLIVLAAVALILVAVLAAIGICERCHVQSGGVYFLISHVLGSRRGTAVGILYVLGQVSWPLI